MADQQQIGMVTPNMPLTTPSPSSSHPSSNQGQEVYFRPLHAVIISLITTVGGYVQFQFQQKNLSLFDEHGSIIRTIFIMLFLYIMGFMAEFKLQNRSHYFAIMKQFTPLFGLLVVVLLLFILSISLGLAAFIIWTFLMIGPTLNLFQKIIQCLRTNHTATSLNLGRDEYLHAVIISLNTTIGGYVLFQFQHMNLSLFDEHGIIMRAVFVMLLLYVMGIMLEFKLQIQSRSLTIIKQFTPLFGLLAVVLLLFILSISLGLAASIIWAFLVVGPTFRLFQEIIQYLHGIIRHIRTNQRPTNNFEMGEIDPTEIEENDLPV